MRKLIPRKTNKPEIEAIEEIPKETLSIQSIRAFYFRLLEQRKMEECASILHIDLFD